MTTRYDRSAIMTEAWKGYRAICRVCRPDERRAAFASAMTTAWRIARQTEADRQREAITRKINFLENQSGPYAKHREERRRLETELAAIAA